MFRMFERAAMVAVVVIGLAAVALAQPPQGGGMRGQGMGPQGGPGMRGPGGPMAALKLTTEQRQKIQEIQERHRAATQQEAEELRGLHEQMRAALFGENPDDAKAFAGRIAALEANLLPKRIAMQAELVKELTPDQKKIAMELNLFGGNGMQGGPREPGMRGGRGGQPVKK